MERILRVVPPPGQGTDPPRRRQRPAPALLLTDEEARHVRAGLRNLRTKFGSWKLLGAAMGVPRHTLQSAASLKANRRHRPSAALALRAAQAGGMPIERLLSGIVLDANACPTCGSARGGAR